MPEKLLLIPWMIAIVYSSIPLFWFAIHPFAGRWRKMRRSPYRALLPLWGLMILSLAWITWPWRWQQIYSTPWMWVPAVPFFAFGLGVYRRMFAEFGGHKLSGETELRPEEHAQQLVTSGLHSRMRHPIYLAHLCNLTGWALGTGLTIVYVLLAVAVCLTFPAMIFIEERELGARFGAQYHEYKARVPLIPWPALKGRTHEQTAMR